MQLPIFIRGKDFKLNIIEELLGSLSLKGTTTADHIYSGLETALETKNFSLSKLCDTATDGAPSMIENRNGLTALLARNSKQNFTENYSYVTVSLICKIYVRIT